MDLDAYDALETHCRSLGHSVPFRYCRRVALGLPCNGIVSCWQEHFDVPGFLQTHFSPEDIGKILAPPKPKMSAILEAIKRAQNAVDSP